MALFLSAAKAMQRYPATFTFPFLENIPLMSTVQRATPQPTAKEAEVSAHSSEEE